MNDLLQLKGTFQQVKNSVGFGYPELPPHKMVKAKHLRDLRLQLINIYKFWETNTIIGGALVSVYYIDVIAKTRRISACFSNRRKDEPNNSIVGAKYTDIKPEKHIITHFISLETLQDTIQLLKEYIQMNEQKFNGVIDYIQIKEINDKKINIPNELKKNSLFVRVIIDAYYVLKFDNEKADGALEEQSIITFYRTKYPIQEILKTVGIEVSDHNIMEGDNNTVLLNADQVKILQKTTPMQYLVSMASPDMATLSKKDFDFKDEKSFDIPDPLNEPVIGVIDTSFDKNVYFSKWVKSESYLAKDFIPSDEDYFHGTAICSIIVDGPTLNKNLDDGCGRFKVKHFAVSDSSKFSSFNILQSIENIVAKNKDIKVWNLSLGSDFPINPNFISPEADILDRIQYENDVIFVIAGTNNYNEESKHKRIGAPADSINGLVVNSVKFDKTSARYTREGPVLSFFNKPDVSYFGGDKDGKITVMTNNGLAHVEGTSLAAPWITRKMAYLIYVLGLTREVAKALIIDSAIGWSNHGYSPTIGHGIVPIRIEEIITSQNSEIKFVLSNTSKMYNTFNYRLPVPINQGKYPYVARATMCYFPSCSRNQGVDYTDSELDISFGRVNNNKIVTINNNHQTDGEGPVYEIDARYHYRKWDNTKVIKELIKDNNRPKKVYSTKLWGISIKSKERLSTQKKGELNFGVVITLKEINGVNRINEFIHQCSLNGWIVNRINIENQVEIFAKAEENIIFDE